ncbi:MAG: carboxymuconolactone decarboxylase family protein [Proteobacteria bacterium]|nr:carboxymuconolactone decarboxylase family protein [Pseudomonadota bacterium]
MTLATFKETLPDFARDTKINLGSILTEEGAPGLTLKQIQGTALACVYATGSLPLREALESEFAASLPPEDVLAAKSAASVMAMNNVYYRFLHLLEDDEIQKLSAKLRMQVIGKPGIDKTTFEAYCLGVSALSGCGNCIKSHAHELKKAGLSNEGIQSIARIAAVINAASVSHRI